TTQVLLLQHEYGIRGAERIVDDLIERLSVSTTVTAASDELLASLASDLDVLDIDERWRRINAAEPYRLKLTCVRAKLDRTRTRLATDSPHQPGR
ncbi:phosphoenolpyruvate carboxylase, partial [Salmonella enterica subsp. enterica serovar Thompson]|nr:phosphoenolpyruvate carboxylase [Salmonella enterica subsp. enterica serovar Thompson]